MITTIEVDPNHPLLSVEEAGELLGLSRAAMYRAIHKGDLPLPLLRISGRWRIPRRAVERLIDGNVDGSGHPDEGETIVDGDEAQ